jgi:hypothetical protein
MLGTGEDPKVEEMFDERGTSRVVGGCVMINFHKCFQRRMASAGTNGVSLEGTLTRM